VGRDWVAIILATGTVLAVNAITAAILWAALFHKSDVNGGISDNATQVLTAVLGGIIGVLGSYIGFRAGQASSGAGPASETGPATNDYEGQA